MTRAWKATAGVLLVLAAGAGLVWMVALREVRVPRPLTTGKLQRTTIESGGGQRNVSVYVPRRLAPDPPLLLVLHASLMDGERMREVTGYEFERLADEHGFIVAYPDGYGGHWNDCRAVGDYEAKRRGVDDVAFLRAVVAHLSREHDIAVNRVFAAGLSNGAQMAFRLALEAPGTVRGIAAVAANLPAPENQTCTAVGAPLPVLLINGTADPLNPYEGGEVALFGLFIKRGMVQSTGATAGYWTSLAGHDAPARSEPLADRDPEDGTRATRIVWSDSARPAVELITVRGGGHTFPQPRAALPRLFGRTSRDFSAAAEIWHFFERELSRAGRPKGAGDL